MTRRLRLMAPSPASGLLLSARRFVQTGHYFFIGVSCAPGFHVRDILPVLDEVYPWRAGLVTVPAAHPCGKLLLLRRRHGQILVTSNLGHLHRYLRVRPEGKK